MHHQCIQEVTTKAFKLKMFACVSKSKYLISNWSKTNIEKICQEYIKV